MKYGIGGIIRVSFRHLYVAMVTKVSREGDEAQRLKSLLFLKVTQRIARHRLFKSTFHAKTYLGLDLLF